MFFLEKESSLLRVRSLEAPSCKEKRVIDWDDKDMFSFFEKESEEEAAAIFRHNGLYLLIVRWFYGKVKEALVLE